MKLDTFEWKVNIDGKEYGDKYINANVGTADGIDQLLEVTMFYIKGSLYKIILNRDLLEEKQVEAEKEFNDKNV